MKLTQLIGVRQLACLFTVPCLLMASLAKADFIEESKASLELRNST